MRQQHDGSLKNHFFSPVHSCIGIGGYIHVDIMFYYDGGLFIQIPFFIGFHQALGLLLVLGFARTTLDQMNQKEGKGNRRGGLSG